MISNPTHFITPSGYTITGSGIFVATSDPIGDAIKSGNGPFEGQCAAGNFPRARGPFAGIRSNIHLCGWPRDQGITQIMPDTTVGSTDNFFAGDGDHDIILDTLNILLDDRAGVKTNDKIGKGLTLIDVNIYGPGSPHDPNWKADTKWGVHTYCTNKYGELRVNKWSIFNEHGFYGHNIQGDHDFRQGNSGMFGGCDIFIANRMNEGPQGIGNVNVEDHSIEDVCVGQGGSGLTFRGGMPTSSISLKRVTGRLGCKPSLAAPFNQNICGLLSVDSADETAPGKGDAAYPGGMAALSMDNCDFEVGTVYPGRTGMIRPVVSLSALGVFTMFGSRIKVTRPAGAYPIALSIKSDVPTVAIGPNNEIDGWIEWHPDQPDGARYHSLSEFLAAHPECAA